MTAPNTLYILWPNTNGYGWLQPRLPVDWHVRMLVWGCGIIKMVAAVTSINAILDQWSRQEIGCQRVSAHKMSNDVHWLCRLRESAAKASKLFGMPEMHCWLYPRPLHRGFTVDTRWVSGGVVVVFTELRRPSCWENLLRTDLRKVLYFFYVPCLCQVMGDFDIFLMINLWSLRMFDIYCHCRLKC